MDDTVWANATRQEFRINPDIRARIHHDSTSKQNLLQKLPLRAIGVRFEDPIRKAIRRKGVFVGFVSDLTKNVSSPHHRRVKIRVKNEAHTHGKQRLSARSI